ncbi:hypothetical protein KAW65_02375 [candidate division WOR-3 bacterium]|nr:hypothetical protein [candidate division WOR-3 bacterium]
MIQEFKPDLITNRKNSLYICAGGFEDRVKGIINILQKLNEKVFKYSFISEYTVHQEDNKENLDFLEDSLDKCSSYHLKNVKIDIDNLLFSRDNLTDRLKKIPREEIEAIFIDISGMTNFLILLILKMAHTIFYDKKIFILYTEAKNYYPKEDEQDEILTLAEKKDDESIMKLSEKLQASGARETLIPTDFKGSFKEDFPTTLIFFVGYEPSRAIGLLETYRPNVVIPCYGDSPHEYFKWRTQFSMKLHEKFRVFEQYPYLKKNKPISTFYISKIIDELEKTYISEIEGRILYENFNIAITPQCSKLQTVATYLFCQSHPDVQVVFCLPGKYNSKRYSEEIGRSWLYEL